MVSFQAHPLSPNQKKAITESENSSKKRKWDDEPYDGHDHDQVEQIFEKRWKPLNTAKSLFDIELHQETPLPLEWQRCLDIQSGQIHFYNTRTHMKTSRDPRRSPEPPSPAPHMSLDLELNLRSCESMIRKANISDHSSENSRPNSDISLHNFHDLFMEPSRPTKSKNPSRLGLQIDHLHHQEMVATVCMKCHMLVMLCRSSPACPNCKYMHPPDQTPPTLFKPRCSSFMC
ncbi:hypothetical protein GBA52_000723 [Prunus armeniaca]|nr:hypothetical protein GBA52_000723 [Prunus armeniaca]